MENKETEGGECQVTLSGGGGFENLIDTRKNGGEAAVRKRQIPMRLRFEFLDLWNVLAEGNHQLGPEATEADFCPVWCGLRNVARTAMTKITNQRRDYNTK